MRKSTQAKIDVLAAALFECLGSLRVLLELNFPGSEPVQERLQNAERAVETVVSFMAQDPADTPEGTSDA